MASLIGRDGELARLRELLDAAAAGASGALVVLGEAGIGKSALVDAAVADAAARGMTVLRARAVEAERDLPFAGLTELLRPLAALREELEPHHAAALGGALGLAPAAGEQAPFGVAVALLALLGAAGERAPGVLVAVDDVHWLDDASLEALSFAARRLLAEGVVVLLGARPEPDRGLRDRGLALLELAALGEEEAARLLREAGGEAIAAEPLRRVLDAAQGNPLALVELARALSDEQLRGAEQLPEPVRPSTAIDRAFRAQLAALPEQAARALLVPAADESVPLARILEALAALGFAPDALEPAERARLLLAEQGRVRFRHPLLRAVVYHSASFAERARAHLALADALGEEGEDGIRRAWHRAAAATEPDEAVAAALESAGEQARARGALAAAAHALARAVELTPDAPARARRAFLAARDHAAVGQPQQALALAGRALDDGPGEPAWVADVQLMRGMVTMRSGEMDAGYAILVDGAERVAAADPRRAAELLLSANLRHRVVGDYASMEADARLVREVVGAEHPLHAAFAELLAAVVRTNVGRGEAARETLARHEALLLAPTPPQFPQEVVTSPAQLAIWLEQFERAERILERMVGRARERSAVSDLIYPLAVRSQLALRLGRLGAAYAHGGEALRLAFDTRQLGLVAITAGLLSEVEAALGREAECREHAGVSIAICDGLGADAMGTWARSGLGLLELGLGRPQQALEPLESCLRLVERIGLVEPSAVQWAANWIEALVRAGRRDEAADGLRWLERGAGTAWAHAALLRCRGLLAADADAEALLERSAAAFDAAGFGFEAARSRLALGERLRRARQRRSAREPLQAARDWFEGAGAVPWAERARDELRASGQATAKSAVDPRETLTPHEYRVALLVAEGRTNPEVAAELYVTRKTVEHHLSQIYRKLGLRSRTELARELVDQVRPRAVG